MYYQFQTLSGHLQELKNKVKAQLGNFKSGHSCLQERPLQSLSNSPDPFY